VLAAGDVATAAAWNVITNDVINLRALANVQQTVLTSATSQAINTTYANLTGITVSITPTASDSKILIHCFASIVEDSAVSEVFYRLARGGTGIFVGDAAGSRVQAATKAPTDNNTKMTFVFLDSPATTSSVTYTLQARTALGAGTTYINRTKTDTDSATFARTATSIIVQEIPA